MVSIEKEVIEVTIKLTVEKSGKRVSIDELDDRFFIPEGDPDRSKAKQDNLTEVILEEK